MMKEATIEHEIRRMVAERGPTKTVCPSEVARSLAGSEDRAKWEPLMQPVRDVAAKMVAAKEIVVTQKGRAVDLQRAKGPVRLRLR